MIRSRGVKIAFGVGGTIIFFVGVFIGSFLVLRTTVSMGSEPQESTASFGTLVSGESEKDFTFEDFDFGNTQNITDDFLQNISREGSLLGLNTEDYTDESFLQNTVLPYLFQNKVNLLSDVENFEPQTQTLISPQKYIDEVNIHFLVLAASWQKIIATPPEELGDPKVKTDFEALVKLLKQNDKELREKNVPLQYGEFHKKVVVLSSAIQQVVREGIIEKEEDPLRSLLVIIELDKVEQFAQRVLAELILIKELNE